MNAAPVVPLCVDLVRHGETRWTESLQHTRYTDITLTKNGENQARKLEPHLRQIRFAHVLSRPLQRAR